MKFAKLSIAALVAVGFTSSAVASDITINPFGTAKLFYETVSTDADGSNDLFAQGTAGVDAATGQARISGGATGSLNKCLGYGFEYMAVDTLGLENNLVSKVAMGAGKGTQSNGLDTQHWASQAYLTYSPCDTFLSNTTFKIGRQYLDTPLAFTENWKIAPNSFDAVVAINKDIINTTLIGAYVGKGNGSKGTVTVGNNFSSYGQEGAYAVGAITSLMDGAIPLSIWAYDVVNVANAAWADAGYKADLGGVKLNLGGQYAWVDPDTDANSYAAGLVGAAAAAGLDATTGYGLKVGTSTKLAGMGVSLMAAYSSVDADGTIALANTATLGGTTGGKKTKLYTAGIYTDGVYVAAPGSDAFKIKASTKIAGIGSLTAQYINNTNDKVGSEGLEVSEIDVILGTSLPGGIGAKLIYINRSHETDLNLAAGSRDTNHVRVVLSSKF